MKWASEQHLPPGDYAVLMILADRANKRNECWPGLASISSTLCISTRQARTYIRRLEDRGLITSEKRIQGKRRTSNKYTLQIPKPSPEDEQAKLMARLEEWAADPEAMKEAFREDAKKDGLTAREFMLRWVHCLDLNAPDLEALKAKLDFDY